MVREASGVPGVPYAVSDLREKMSCVEGTAVVAALTKLEVGSSSTSQAWLR